MCEGHASTGESLGLGEMVLGVCGGHASTGESPGLDGVGLGVCRGHANIGESPRLDGMECAEAKLVKIQEYKNTKVGGFLYFGYLKYKNPTQLLFFVSH